MTADGIKFQMMKLGRESLLGRISSLNELEKQSSGQKGLKSMESMGYVSFLDILTCIYSEE